MSEQPFDIFISYKSTDAHAVRIVAETLMAGGVRVWFAEYQVLLTNFDDFQRAIDHGIHRASYALIFTNDAWATSPYCNHEIDLIQKVMDPRHILQVCIPPEGKPAKYAPILKTVPSLVYSGNPGEVIDFLRTHTDIGLCDIPLGFPATYPQGERISLPHGVSFCPGTLRPQRSRVDAHRTAVFPGDVFRFKGSISGYDVELEVSVNPYRRACDTHPIPRSATLDDRITFERYRDYALWWIRGAGEKEVGLHLLFLNNKSQMGISTRAGSPTKGILSWGRIYPISVESSDGCESGEVKFHFVVDLPDFGVDLPDEPTLSFREFCRVAGCLESIVQTLTYDLAGEPEWATRRTLIRGGLTVGWTAFVVAMQVVWANHTVSNCAMAGILGVLCGSLVSGSLDGRAGRVLLRMAWKFPREALTMSVTDNNLPGLVETWKAIVGVIVEGALTGLSGLPGIVLIACGLAGQVQEPIYWALVGGIISAWGLHQYLRKVDQNWSAVHLLAPKGPDMPPLKKRSQMPLLTSDHRKLLGELRYEDASALNFIKRLVVAGLAVGLGLGYLGWYTCALLSIVVFFGMAGVIWRRYWLVCTLGRAHVLVQEFHRNPQVSIARSLVDIYREQGERSHSSRIRAVQWAAYLAAQLNPDPEDLIRYADTLIDLAENNLDVERVGEIYRQAVYLLEEGQFTGGKSEAAHVKREIERVRRRLHDVTQCRHGKEYTGEEVSPPPSS